MQMHNFHDNQPKLRNFNVIFFILTVDMCNAQCDKVVWLSDLDIKTGTLIKKECIIVQSIPVTKKMN